MPKQLLHTLQSSGTANGQSGIMEIANGCPRRWWLRKKHGWPDGVFEPDGTRIGTIGHAFMEIYYRENDDMLDTTAVKFTNNAVSEDDLLRREAQRIFTAYQARFPVKEIGTVIGSEVALPQNKAQAARISEAVGYPDYTCRIDLVTKCTAADLRRLRKTRHVNLRKPGIYLWDWKFLMMILGITLDSYRNSVQPIYYQSAWNAAFPKKKAQAMVMSLIPKAKNREPEHVLVPPPSRLDTKMMHAVSSKALKVLETEKPPYPCNIKQCYSWNRECEFLQAGLCNRS